MTKPTSPCEQCGQQAQIRWIWRDPAIEAEDRYLGHGILYVCAECLAANGGPDYRGLTHGDLLFRLNAQRARKKGKKMGLDVPKGGSIENR